MVLLVGVANFELGSRPYQANIVQKFHACEIYDCNTHATPTPLHPVIFIGPFVKWGIDFMTSNPHSVGVQVYIILVVDYFTK